MTQPFPSEPSDDRPGQGSTPAEPGEPLSEPRGPRQQGPTGPPPGAPNQPYGQPGYPQPGQQPGQPQPGYGQQPPPGVAPRPYSDVVGRQLSPDETTWSLLAHLSGIVLGFLGPLLVMLVKGNESPYTRKNAVEALNFQITLVIAYVISVILMVLLIGFLLLPLLYVADVVLSVLAGVAASKGQDYKYPFTWRFIS